MNISIKNKILILAGFLTVSSLSYPFSQVHAYWSLDKNGSVIYTKLSPGQILGGEVNKEEVKKIEDKKDEEKKSEEQKNEQKQEVKKEEQNFDSQNKSNNQINSSSKEFEKHTAENKTDSSGQQSLKSEDVEKVEIHKIENENESHASGEGKMEVNIKKNNKEEIKGRQESFEMETENGDKVHIELSPEKTQMEIKKNGISASVDLPLSVNPTLKKLILTTPDGEIPIESLPDEVVSNLKKDKQIDERSDVHIDVKYEDGQIVYKIEERKHKKIVGIIPIDLIKNMSVQDGTGTVLSTQESFMTKLLSLISF